VGIIGFKKATCKDCYKCVRLCPVKAIRIKNEHASFVAKDCILCGRCTSSCPQRAIKMFSDLEKVKAFLSEDIYTAAIISPAYLGIYDKASVDALIQGLYQLGFNAVHKTQEGSRMVNNAYKELLRENKMDNIITSFCPAINQLVEKYHPDMIPYMAPIVSPMIAQGKFLKESKGSHIKVVSITSCLADSVEATKDARTKGYIDAVISFKDVKAWLLQSDVQLGSIDGYHPDSVYSPTIDDAYAARGGTALAIEAISGSSQNYRSLVVDSIEECVALFDSIRRHEIKKCLIEAASCKGGCIDGPVSGVSRENQFKAQLFVQNILPEIEADKFVLENVAIDKEFHSLKTDVKMPSEEDIRKILSKIGKDTPNKELNCGACGFTTCREKAIATLQNKSEITLCIPYMYEQARSLSDVILSVTPNMIMLIDEQMRIKDFNNAAEVQFDIAKEDAVKKSISEILGDENFRKVFETKRSIMNLKVEYPQYHLTTIQNIIYVRQHHIAIGIFRDITAEEKDVERRYKMKMKAVDAAQMVIDKQMLIAQEIAGLLGETTAETKVTLTNLRDSILHDGDEPK